MIPTHPPVEESVIRELNRRRVLRVVVAYLALSFGGLNLAHLLLTHLGGPPWGFRALLGAAALGFPLTAVLSWTYDITPKGIVKTPEDPNAEAPEEPAPKWAWGVTVAFGLLVGAAAIVLELLIF